MIDGLKYWFKWFTPRRCGHCERIRFGVIRRHQKTDYYYDEDNYEAFCPKCQDYADEYWTHHWLDFTRRTSHETRIT